MVAVAEPIPVRLQRQGEGFQLLRDGKPYFIKGGGGSGSPELLAKCGGNSIRTWGVGPDTQKVLDNAHQLGLTVTVGLWLGHKDHGFDYDDPVAVQKQLAATKQAVQKYKDHPALLMWGVGNEMEMNNETIEMWRAVQQVAQMVHQVDPQHPTMTVIAELGEDKVQQIHQHCPDVDVIGVNTYGGGVSLAERYRKSQPAKPYVITEFGPPGAWEVKKTTFGAPLELTSTEKAAAYEAVYKASVQGEPDLCLGSYAFIWGHKIEATATWFGMFLSSGDRLAAVDTMQTLWSGKPPAELCPTIKSLQLTSADQVEPGGQVSASVSSSSSPGTLHSITWALAREQATYAVTGLGGPRAAAFPGAIATNQRPNVTVTMPKSGGVYRLYCFVRTQQGAAVGSLPIKVNGPVRIIKASQPKLPLVIYADGQPAPPFAPSGWMGDTAAIEMQEDYTDNPHAGKTCLRVRYKKSDGWGAVVWQHPANDWGEQPGGYDLSEATQLVFWARGKQGGEKVKFGFGLIGIDKKYHDSCKSEREITLTPDWKQYTFDLSEKELIRIKSGFLWSLAGQGKAIEFYLDDIEYR